MRIVIKNAIDRKPDYMYYLDKHGNVLETRLKNSKQTITERIVCLWIDFKRLFK